MQRPSLSTSVNSPYSSYSAGGSPQMAPVVQPSPGSVGGAPPNHTIRPPGHMMMPGEHSLVT